MVHASLTLDPAAEFSRLRTLVLSCRELIGLLAGMKDDDLFVTHIMAIANDLRAGVDEATIRHAIRPDPLGLSRFAGAAAMEIDWPPPGFLPIRAGEANSGCSVDWAWFGHEPLTDPFFEGSIRTALRRPFNRAFRWRQSLADFIAGAPQSSNSLKPDGFIFHMSRCGSTLVSQMLAQSERNIVISEAAPIDTAVQSKSPEFLRAMMLAFGRPRSDAERHFFIKLDSWHALALPLFERAFPGTPWLFLYRDPVEVMVSQQREPGAQTVPQLVAPSIYGIGGSNIPGPDYTARVLNRICTAAADALRSVHGIAVNYRDLPDAFETRILPHFGVTPGNAERAAMRTACRVDAKAPFLPFAADSAAKRAAASDNLRALAQCHLNDIIRRLDDIAAGRANGEATTLF